MIFRSEAVRRGGVEGVPLFSAPGVAGVAGVEPRELMARSRQMAEPMQFASVDEPDVLEVEPEQTVRKPADDAAARAERELLARLLSAREQGSSEARTIFDVELQTRLAEERRRVERMAVVFARDRQRFFAAAEGQVVRLGLAIARKVLLRDSVTGDGMPLRAAVKAALGRVQDASRTTLRVPESELEGWAEMVNESRLGERLSVVVDTSMTDGQCVLETSVGTVELGVEEQLLEVERVFAELTQDHDLGSERETRSDHEAGDGGR